jgi:hypothetical protein
MMAKTGRDETVNAGSRVESRVGAFLSAVGFEPRLKVGDLGSQCVKVLVEPG